MQVTLFWSDQPTLLRHYRTVLIDFSHWNIDGKNSSDMIDLNLQVVSLETAESISFLRTLWCSVPPLAPHHNSPLVPVELRLGLEIVSYPFTTNSQLAVN